jgi:hypothetical protein
MSNLLHDLLADTLTQEQVGVVEVLEELSEECVTVRGNRFLTALPFSFAVVVIGFVS